MSRLYILIFLVFSTLTLAQETEPDCGWYGTKTVAERNAIFPFNKSKKVVLVSYPFPVEDNFYREDSVKVLAFYDAKRGIAFKIEDEDYEHFYLVKEETILTDAWVNQLSHVLIDYQEKKKPKGYTIIEESKCYNPRNSILFYDENDVIICCYEICFSCSQIRMWPDPDSINKYVCNTVRLQELKNIFKQNGITYGIDEK